MKKINKKKTVKLVALALFLALSIVLAVGAYTYYKKNGITGLEHLVSSMGAGGVLLMLFLQIVQVTFAVVPGEPIELVMGAMYGTWCGLLLCLAGCVVGSLCVFAAVKFFGKGYIESFADSKSFEKLKFLKDPARRDVFVFLLMFIPGTPKDVLTYFAPFTGINLLRFLIISTVARIPSVITSTYVGSTFAEGSYIKSAAVFVVVGVVSLVGIFIYNKIVENKNKSEKNIDTHKQDRQN